MLQPLVFFLIVTTLFPLGLSLQLSLLRDMAPGVLWVAALLSSLLSLDSLFKSDADDGTLEQLALSGQGLMVIVIAKTLAHWLVTGAALVKGTRCAFSRRGSSAPEPAIAPRLRPRRRGVRLVHQVRLATAGNCDRDYHRRRDHG